MSKKNTTEKAVEIQRLAKRTIRAHIVGKTPFIANSMSAKVRQQLLLPPKRKSKKQMESRLKHDPLNEFRNCFYKSRSGPTLIQHLSSAFKAAMVGAAIEAGAKKAEIRRLVWVEGERVDLYGVPEIFMSVTRSADAGRTPDIRTRLILPRWACTVDVSFVETNIKEKDVMNLILAAGDLMGVGDWRNEKGSGTYGKFEPVNEDDEEFLAIVAEGGRDAQVAAVSAPACYDEETEEMLQWFFGEASDRSFNPEPLALVAE